MESAGEILRGSGNSAKKIKPGKTTLHLSEFCELLIISKHQLGIEGCRLVYISAGSVFSTDGCILSTAAVDGRAEKIL